MKTRLIVFIALFVISCNSETRNNGAKISSTDTSKKNSNAKDTLLTKKNAANEPIIDTLFGDSKAKSILKLIILPTRDGIADDSEVMAFHYPDYAAIDSVPEWHDQIAVYGACYREWLGPKGWVGRGLAGANGGTMVYLYPPGGKEDSTEYISYYSEPVSVGSILSNAGQYFHSARKKYNDSYNEDGTNPLKIPDGIEITRMSYSVVTYSIPPKNGLLIQGVAYYNDTEGIGYFEAKFILPAKQSRLSNFLSKYYTNEMMHRNVTMATTTDNIDKKPR